MKARITFVLFAAVVLFTGTAMAAGLTADVAPTLEEPRMSPAEVAPVEDVAAEPLFMAPSLKVCPHPQPSGVNCSAYNTDSCTYEWDCSCCCRLAYQAPGAFCPSTAICL